MGVVADVRKKQREGGFRRGSGKPNSLIVVSRQGSVLGEQSPHVPRHRHLDSDRLIQARDRKGRASANHADVESVAWQSGRRGRTGRPESLLPILIA